MFLRTSDVSCTLNFVEGTEDASSKIVMPGDNIEMEATILHPMAVEQGQRFNLREGGRTVATGLVIRILEYPLRSRCA